MAIDQRIPEMEEIVKEYSVSHGGWVEKGGKWKPKDCVSKAKVILCWSRYRYNDNKIKMDIINSILSCEIANP